MILEASCEGLREYCESHTGPETGVAYDTNYSAGALAFYWQNFERPYLAALFSRLQGDHSKRYLDFACGTGRILQLGVSYFHESVGIDVSQSMLGEARSKVPQAELILADVLTETVNVGKFDVVTLFRFLLNAGPDLRDGVLRWLRTVLQDDGVLVLNNHRNAWSARGVACRVRRAMGGRHRSKVLSGLQVRSMLARCGFRVVDRFGFGVIPSRSNRLLLPAGFLRQAERILGSGLQTFAENRIYVCRPV